MIAKSNQTDKSAPPAPDGDVWDNIKLTQDSSNVKQYYSVAFEEEDYACLCLHYQIMIMFSETTSFRAIHTKPTVDAARSPHRGTSFENARTP